MLPLLFLGGHPRTREASLALIPVLHAEAAHLFICVRIDPILQPLEAPEHATHNPQPGPSLRSPISGMATAAGDQATASTSASAPEIHTERSLSASPIAASPSYNPASSTSSLGAKQESSLSSNVLGAMEPSATASAQADAEPPDPQILEALRNKDRIYVLKLGEQMETLIRERGCVSVVFLLVARIHRHTTTAIPHDAPLLRVCVDERIPPLLFLVGFYVV